MRYKSTKQEEAVTALSREKIEQFENLYEDFIARRILELRAKRGVSARVMSTELGQNTTYISQIENKKAMPSVQGLFAICAYFDLTPQGFFDESDGFFGLTSSIVHEISTLDNTELFLIRELTRKLNQNKKRGSDSDFNSASAFENDIQPQ